MSNIADGELTSIAFCWSVERRDGAGVAMTSHDRRIEHGGITYMFSPGIVPASISRGLGLEPHSGEVSGALSSDAFSDTDLAAGRWDGARVRLLAVDWTSPEDEAIELLAGELGEVAIKGEAFSADLRGAAWRLQNPVCPTTSPECRAEFGDKKCRVDLSGRSISLTVVSATDDGELQLAGSVGEQFLFGRLRFMGGANCGLSSVVTYVNGDRVRTRDLPRAGVEQGTRVEIREGCDKRLTTCASRFNNAINFRGEPHLPGNDLLTRYPGA
jgi:uncharacterized phage protein (TIGR02218 family)